MRWPHHSSGEARRRARAQRLTRAIPAVSVAVDGPPAWEVKREAGASSLNAGAAPATVSDEPQADATGISREGGRWQRPASQETCHHELCFGGVVGAGCTGRERG